MSKYYGDSEQVSLQSVSMPKSKNLLSPSISCRNIDTYSQPPAELEMVFAAVENHNQKRFLEKYNYDIVRDV
ncbi:Cyclin-dependent kinase inhibitor 7 [Striga hermonthica]|uniref:Cyclin-dependent kinase inhibitor 7 n=1 Tax=Striga hermonthica TaxID=68872 RepID=A0A9N7RBK5_STRHE|nr:Cyclin-dependent kinase inhibitor 7 [Striga hermonthica]